MKKQKKSFLERPMSKRAHVIIVSLYLVVAGIFLLSTFAETPTGTTVKSFEENTLVNCEIVEGWESCDVISPDGTLIKESYRRKIS